MKQIPISKTDLIALVDLKHHRALSTHRWFLHSRGYAVRGNNGHTIYMHRVVAGAGNSDRVDHRDGNKLNNQRSNLRICSQSDNLGNSRAHKDKLHSKFKGVTWDGWRSRWVARICKNYRKYHLGYFTDETKAARAYDTAARKFFKSFALTNSP